MKSFIKSSIFAILCAAGVSAHAVPLESSQGSASATPATSRAYRVPLTTRVPVSFAHGVVKGSMTVGSAPVLMHVVSVADLLPDYLRANVARCEIIGDAQVEKASGRVYVNTQALSCFDKTGDSSVQAKFVGYLVGTDNKLGLATQDIVAYAGATVVVVRSGELEFAKLP